MKAYLPIRSSVSVIQVIEADWGRRSKAMQNTLGTFQSDCFRFPADWLLVENVPITEVVEVRQMAVESRPRFGSAVIRGLVGGAILGLFGAVLGAITAKTNNTVTFGVRLRDGRSFVAVAQSSVWQRLQSFLHTYKPFGDTVLAGEPKPVVEDLTWRMVGILSVVTAFVVLLVFAIESR